MNTDNNENTKHRFMSRVSDTFNKAVNKAVESLGIKKEDPGNIKQVESPRVVKKEDDVKEWIKDPEVKKIKLQDFMAACGYFPEKGDCDDLKYFNLPLIRNNQNLTDDVKINTRGNYFHCSAVCYWDLFSFEKTNRNPDIAALACLVLGSKPEDVEADIKRKMQEFKEKPVKEPDRVLMTTDNVNLLKKCENPYREYCNSIKPHHTSIRSGDPQKLPSDILNLYEKKERAYEDGLNYSFSDRIDPNVSSSLSKATCEAETKYYNSLMQDMADTVKGIIMDLSEGRLYYDPIKDQCLTAEQFFTDSRSIPERTAELDKWIRKNRFSLEVGQNKIDYVKLAKKSHEVLVQKWKNEYVKNFKGTDLYPYLNSMTEPHDLLSGDDDLLPKNLSKLYNKYYDESEEYYIISHELCDPDEVNEQYTKLRIARQELLAEIENQLEALTPSIVCEPEVHYGKDINNGNSNINNKTDMAKKKTEDSSAEVKETAREQKSPSQKRTEPGESKTREKQERREPQMVTCNGDKITHAHCFKAKDSDNWFVTAKINDVPLRARLMHPNDVESVMNKTMSVPQMMEKYYPTKIAPKVKTSDYRLPQGISTPEGDFVVNRFNVYKETNPHSDDYGKYRFYTQVGEHKMSCTASREDLDAYFDRVTTPVNLIIKNFGDRLGMKEHYQQFHLPESVNLESKNILINKNENTNRFQISVKVPDKGLTPVKEISYEDRQVYLSKIATKSQLAAKYLNDEISTLMRNSAIQHEKQMNVKR